MEQNVIIDHYIPKPESYGAQQLSDKIIEEIKSISPLPLSHFLTRKIFDGQVGLEDLISHSKSKKPFYIYLPISPSDRMTHLRHVAFLQFAVYLQKVFDCYVFIHVNEYKSFCRDESNSKFETSKKWVEETVKDILSFDFIQEKTIILSNEACVQLDYVLLCDLQRKVTLGSFFESFFTDDNVNVGVMDGVFQEAVCAIPLYAKKIFSDSQNTRCLMLLRPSQMSLYKFTCQVAKLISQPSPAAIFGGFVPALQSGQKMPKLAKFALGHNDNKQEEQKGKKGGKQKNEVRDYMTIYMKNTTKEVTTKLNKFAFSGGCDTLTEQREKGANLSVDIPAYYLRIFYEDESDYNHLIKYYGPGELEEGNDKRLGTGDIKKKCGQVLGNLLTELQQKRSKVTKEQIENVYKIRQLN